jgi:hypothetical protein
LPLLRLRTGRKTPQAILWDETPFSFTLKREITGPSETLVSICKIILCHIPEDHKLNIYSHDALVLEEEEEEEEEEEDFVSCFMTLSVARLYSV